MQFEESIYSLIPPEVYVPAKPKRHRSLYPPTIHPTASTFGLHTTSKPVCANLAGKYNLEGSQHFHTAMTATMGLARGRAHPDSNNFTKKYTGNPILIPKEQGKFCLLK